MSNKSIIHKLKRYHKKLNGCTIEYELDKYDKTVIEINQYRNRLRNLSDSNLRDIAVKLKESVRSGKNPDNCLVEAYSLVKETVSRVLKIEPVREQLIGAIALNMNKLIEMNTGEGKTLVAVFPAFLNGLSGKGVHVLTFNDYLAKRDALWMKPVYDFLGLSVGYVQEWMSGPQRKAAYFCDITYLTAKESGFDFLRDGLCNDKKNIVHRNLNFAIIDEADSILIDESRIPLVIAGTSENEQKNIHKMPSIVRKFIEKKDYDFDQYARNIFLTENGINKVEEMLCCGNLYDEKNSMLLSELNNALHAQYLIKRNVDYIVRHGKVEQVDEFTGRVADKRRWPDGLQAAVEAKENVAVNTKGKILNSISIQYFIGLYSRKCAMTATARSAEEEFRNFYGLHTVVIGSHKKCIRKDEKDLIFFTKAEKNKALIKEIKKVHMTGRPVLVGTRSVEESASLAESLRKQGIECKILNAENDEFEAMIIADAGKLNAVTISTNMAGRGVDICLGHKDEKEKEAVAALGGLYVIGTNRHESVRIDNQLRGRAARQGDPGSTRFFVSLEDDLFISYRLSELIPPEILSSLEHGEINNPFVKKEINRVQRIVEGQNYEIKLTLSRYTYIIEKQRKIIYTMRKNILYDDSITEYFKNNSEDQYLLLSKALSKTKLQALCRKIFLSQIDRHWRDYISEMAVVREGIHLRRIGGEDPLFEFHKLAIEIFDNMYNGIETDALKSFNELSLTGGDIDLVKSGLKTPASTWAYLINDKGFEDIIGVQFLSNIGLSIGVLITWPFILLIGLYKRIFKPYIN